MTFKTAAAFGIGFSNSALAGPQAAVPGPAQPARLNGCRAPLRLHVRAFRAEKQEHWFAGLESTFTTFSGVPEEVLMDNPRALVVRHDAVSRSVQFNDRLIAFSKHWSFRPRACAPYRARTKGKTENGVGYVKKNAIAGHSFASWEAFEAHLARWEREVANFRIHGTTGEAPIIRFARDEAHRLKPLGGRASFGSLRELTRIVGNDCAIEIDTNSYSVPWRLIGERVAVTVAAGEVRIRHGVHQVAVHEQLEGAPAADRRSAPSRWCCRAQWRGPPAGDCSGGAGNVSTAFVVASTCRI